MIVSTVKCPLTERPTLMALRAQFAADEILLKRLCDVVQRSHQGTGFTITVRSHDGRDDFCYSVGEDNDNEFGVGIGQ